MTTIGLDASVAVPLLVTTHAAHGAVVRWWDGRPVALSGHALAETYSVLTRLPGDIRLTAADAATLLDARFEPALLLTPVTASGVHSRWPPEASLAVRCTTPSSDWRRSSMTFP